MSNNQQELESFLKELKFDDEPDYGHRDRLQEQLLRVREKHHSQPDKTSSSTWRIIMKSRYIKFAVAASIVIGLLTILHVAGLPDGSSVAWAIEQSLQAMNEVSTVHISGTRTGELVPPEKQSKDSIRFNIWARKSPNGKTSGELRFEGAPAMKSRR